MSASGARALRPGRRARAVLGLLAVSLLCVLSTPGAPAAQAQAQVTADSDAVATFGSCLVAEKAGDLLVLLDQSGSLRDTDPDDVRVDAARFLLQQFARTSEDVQAELRVAVAGFDRDFELTAPWQPLDDTTLPGLLSGLETYEDRDAGFDTDYVNAVAGATRELRSQQQRAGGQRCQAVVWFSDGEYSVEPRNSGREVERYGTTKDYAPGADLRTQEGTDAAEEQGVQELCRTGGRADQLRAGGTTTFAIGLGEGVDYGLMERIATGSAGSAACGETGQRAVGDFYPATDVHDLLFAINRIGGLVEPEDEETGVCPVSACPAVTRDIVLDASIRSVDVVAGTTEPGIDVLLSGPSGAPPTRLSHTEDGPLEPFTVSGQQVTGSWLSDRLLQLSMDRVDGGWDGRWSLVFVDPDASSPEARARTQIRITGDLVPRLVEGEPLRSVEDNRVEVGIASEATQEPVAPESVLGTATVSATLVTADGTELPLAVGLPLADAAAGIEADLSGVSPGAATLELVLAVTTRGTTIGGTALPGTELEPRPAEVPVEVLPPLDFPVVGQRAEFGSQEGAGPHLATLPVTGPGCVWLEGATAETFPEGAQVRVTSPADSAADCLEVQEGERSELELALELDEAGNGSITGRLDVRLAPLDAPDDALSGTATFAADVRRPRDAVVLGGVFALALGLGVGLPLAFLYLVKHLTAKIPGKGLRVGVVPLALVGREVQRDGAPLSLSLADTSFQTVDPRGVRTLEVAGLSLRTRTGLSPTAAPYTEVTAAGRVRTSEGSDRLPLAVHGGWVAVLAPDLTTARLVVLLPSDATAGSYERMAREVRERLPGLVQQLRDQGGPPPAAPEPGGWSGAPTPAPSGSGWGGAPAPPSSGGWGRPSPPGTPPSAPGPAAPRPPGTTPPGPPASGGTWGPAPPGGGRGPLGSP